MIYVVCEEKTGVLVAFNNRNDAEAHMQELINMDEDSFAYFFITEIELL